MLCRVYCHPAASTCIGLIPNTRLSPSQPSYMLSLNSTLAYAAHAVTSFHVLDGQSTLPVIASSCSAYTARAAYRARMRNVLAGPWRVCKLSSRERAISVVRIAQGRKTRNHLLRSLVFSTSNKTRGIFPSNWVRSANSPSPRACPMAFFS
jgi:hypothetical protein